MGLSITYKILEKNKIDGKVICGADIRLKTNQTLTQDTTGTMVYLQLLELGVRKKAVDRAVAYIDHNTLQLGYENADDHAFIESVCKRFGIVYSKAGNGICHQLHLERFAVPGDVLIGSDSHTPTCGGAGMFAVGAGGLDVAIALSHGYYEMKVPKVMNVVLTGMLSEGVGAKDIILHILKVLTVKGGVNYVLEYSGEGIRSLSVTERATICNMGAELGATTSIFPSDDATFDYLNRQGRSDDFNGLFADDDAHYDEVLNVDLSELKPQVAQPHSPDNVVDVDDIKGPKVDQVAIGSCTNASYSDLMTVAKILKGRMVAREVSLTISPGSSSVLKMLTDNGAISDMIEAGARILEASCGPCIGMGQAPKSDAVSLRTFNRNFKGRCGTSSANVYLVSPETAAWSSIKGYLESPVGKTGVDLSNTVWPEYFDRVDSYFINYDLNPNAEIVMGPNIKPFPLNTPLQSSLEGNVILKTGDNITTDDIVPSSANLLPLRSNVPELSKYCFQSIDPEFYNRSRINKGGFIVGGENYGQGSSREHAALVPLYLGIRAVIARSFARIHKGNLINSGILPLVFESEQDYEKISEDSHLELKINFGSKDIEAIDQQNGERYNLRFDGSDRDFEIIRAGGAILYLRGAL
ncbi:MAG: aconitate hydratase [Clostridiales bacterium]|nr:aconitate hydratase [Clostridiales bacterium]